MSDAPPVLHAEDIAGAAFEFRHPLAPEFGCSLAPMSRMAGMVHGAINVVRIAPGEQAFPLHRHHGQEEWAYVVEGSGEVQLDTEVHALAPGSFVIFPAAGAAHAVRNTAEAEMVCLMGGSAPPSEVIDFPELGTRVAAMGGAFYAAPEDAFNQIVPGGQKTGDQT